MARPLATPKVVAQERAAFGASLSNAMLGITVFFIEIIFAHDQQENALNEANDYGNRS